MKVQHKTIIVTGAGSGMGRELTLQLIGKGARVAMVDINTQGMSETAAMAGGSNVSTHETNISDRTSVEKLPGSIIEEHGTIDGIINNAGIIQPFVDVKDLEYEKIERIMNINFYGTLYMTKTFLPYLLARPEAHIANVSSMGGFIPFPGQTFYGASKAAVKLFTEGLYAEMRNTRVGVTVIHPGAINTNIMSNSGIKTKAEEAESKKTTGNVALSAEKAAATIISAIEKNKFRALVGKDAILLDILYRMYPKRAVNFIVKQMKKNVLLLIALLFSIQVSFSQIKAGRHQSFDTNWAFKKGSDIDAKAGTYDDSRWRKLDVPHDWSIEDLEENSTDSTIGPFYKNAVGKNKTAFTVGGTAWYRKHFTLDKSTSNNKVYIQFDGVYMNADVWINGHHLGNHPNGYTSFIYDLTAHLNPAGTGNVIALQVKNEGDNSRWYTGSGVYRHVWLHVVNSTHVENWGVQVMSNRISAQSAEIHIATTVTNPGANTLLTTELYSADNKLVASNTKQVAANNKTEQFITLKNPKLWGIETPHLYTARLTLKQNGKIIDTYSQDFGVRTIKFDAETGFTLNGKSIKLKGGCIHHDNGPLGSAAINRAEERKIELLKKNGYNAVRFAHNPYSAELLAACDRLGLLVMNESFDMWNTHKTPDDYAKYFNEWWEKDLTAHIQKDINHPSIIMWSIGNEIPEITDSTGYQTSRKLADAVHRLDPSRPVTNAIPFYIPLVKGLKWDVTAPAFASLDIGGYNYTSNEYENDHKKYPDRIMVATEYFPPKALEEWNYVERNPYVIGMFSWSALDYLGEAGLGLARLKNTNEKLPGFQEMFMAPEWPIFNAYTGELDLIGNKKSASYYLDVVWRRSPIEMVVHRPIPKGKKEILGFYDFPDELKCWTWKGHENDSLQVRVFTRNSKVKLELNGTVIAEQSISKESITATFSIPYVPGKLVARSYEGDKEIASETIETAGEPVAIRLKADRPTIKANRNDLAYIAVEIIDKAGNVVLDKDDLMIHFQIEGNGRIAAVGNGNPKDMSSFQKPEKKVFQGKGLVIIQPNEKGGIIKLTATAAGLNNSILMIKSQ